MNEIKNTILRCMVKDLRDKFCDDELYRAFICNLVDKNFDFLIRIIKEHGSTIWTEDEIETMSKEDFINAFFA